MEMLALKNDKIYSLCKGCINKCKQFKTNSLEMKSCPKYCSFESALTKRIYKIHFDGSNWVGIDHYRMMLKNTPSRKEKTEIDVMFDSLFDVAYKKNYTRKNLYFYILNELKNRYPYINDLEKFVTKNIKRRFLNIYNKIKRFRRKVYMNRWNYFVTFTYDDLKCSQEEFRIKLKKCLSNLATRRGWRYIGAFESGSENGRLHFHGLLYVPYGQMIGEIDVVNEYSVKLGKVRKSNSNSFFYEKFGKNDFAPITTEILRVSKTAEYIVKYISKSNERITNSRGVCGEILKYANRFDIVCSYTDYVEKNVFFDDFINWQFDILGLEAVQLSM